MSAKMSVQQKTSSTHSQNDCGNLADSLFNSFKSLDSVYRHFTTNRICLEWLVKVRWGKVVICPHCGGIVVYRSKKNVSFHCDECNSNFTPLYGTIFQSTKLPLRKWFAAIWLTINNKKGVSSMMLSRELGITQKSAWYLLHKLRQLLPQDETKLEGEVQIDCGYIGGLLRWCNQRPKSARDYLRNKVALVGLASPDKYVVKVIDEGNWNNISPILNTYLSTDNVVYTDLGKEFMKIHKQLHIEHYTVCHEDKEWKNPETGASTSKVEQVWANIRRHQRGIYHKLPKKRAQFYVDEFVYRYNTLKLNQQQRAKDFFSKIFVRVSYRDIDRLTNNITNGLH